MLRRRKWFCWRLKLSKEYNWVCLDCGLEFRTGKRANLSIHCSRCGRAKGVVGSRHPLVKILGVKK